MLTFSKRNKTPFLLCFAVVLAVVALYSTIISSKPALKTYADEAITFQTANGEPTETAERQLTDDEDVAALANEIIEQTGLGLGINVLTAQTFDDFSLGYNIFDPVALQALTINKQQLNRSSSFSRKTTNVSELASVYGVDLGINVSDGSLLKALEGDVTDTLGFDIDTYGFKYFYLLRHKVEKYRLWLSAYNTKETYANLFTASFLTDLSKVQAGTMTASAFFDRYGTHIVGSAVYGGRLNASFTVLSDKIYINGSLKTAVDGTVSMDDVDTLTRSSVYASMKDQLGAGYSASDIVTNFAVNASGGIVVPGTSLSVFERYYESWCNSFEDEDNSVLIDYDDDGLVGIWSILPDEYSAAATKLQNAFVSAYDLNYDGLCEKFKNTNRYDYAGGLGTADDPYLIKTEKHLKNIEKHMDANYSVESDITLTTTNWEPIGGCYKEKAFSGELNGNHKTIKNLQRSSDIEEKNNRIYFGLFGYVTGNVQKLYFADVNITFTGPRVNNGNTRVFVGALAGYMSGDVDRCRVLSGTVSYDACTNGTAFVGGLVGLANGTEFYFCYNYADIVGGRYYGVAGGIAGYTKYCDFSFCYNYGDILAIGTGWGGGAFAGGIAGAQYQNATSTFYSCTSSDAATLTAKPYASFPDTSKKETSATCAWNCDENLE